MSNEKKNDGGQAFPYSGMERIKGPITGAESVLPVWHGGMTLRDYFSAKAMQAMLSSEVQLSGSMKYIDKHGGSLEGHVAACSYEIADAMLKAREE